MSEAQRAALEKGRATLAKKYAGQPLGDAITKDKQAETKVKSKVEHVTIGGRKTKATGSRSKAKTTSTRTRAATKPPADEGGGGLLDRAARWLSST